MKYDLSKGQILAIASNSDVYLRGEKYYYDEKIQSAAFCDVNGGERVEFRVEGNYRNYTTTIEFGADGGLKSYKCDCESHHIWKGACKHVVAGLLCLSRGDYHRLDIANSQRAARGLADAIEKQIFSEIDGEFAASGFGAASETAYTLSPTLIVDGADAARVEFSVGASRMYVVKNLPRFLGRFKAMESAEYGKTTISHNPALFTGPSRDLLGYLQNERDIFDEFQKSFGHGYQARFILVQDDSRFHNLSRRNTDGFFEMFLNKTLTVKRFGNRGAAPMTVRADMPPFSYALEREKDAARLVGETRECLTLTGAAYKYFFHGDTIYRVNVGDGEILANVQNAVNKVSGGRLSFEGGDLVKMMTVALPRLRKLGVIGDVTGEAPELSAARLLPRLYFDADGGDVVCDVEFAYENEDAEGAQTPGEALRARDLAGEYKVLRRLQTVGFAKTRGEKYVLAGDDPVYDFLHEGITGFQADYEVYVTEALRGKAARPARFSMGVRLAGNLLEIKMDSAGYSFSDLLDALESIKEKKKYFRLWDGRYLNLQSEETQSAAAMLMALDVTKKDLSKDTLTLPKYRALYLDSLAGGAALDRDERFTRLAEDFRHIENAEFPVPPTLENVLRGYQRTGYKWLKTLAAYGFGGILADDMGLGKTLQVIAVLLSEKAARKKTRAKASGKGEKLALVVAPTSLLFNWESEIRRFAPELVPAVINGLPEKRREILSVPADVYITTYDTLKRDIDNYENIQFGFLIADEAQNIKNHMTQNARAVKAVSARNRFALTGTPIENSLTELWSIFDFIMPGYLHSAGKFSRLYETPIVRNNDETRAKLLRDLITPFMLRRLKTDVLTELPEKTETTLYAELYDEQKKIYLAHMLKARGELDEIMGAGFERGRIKILSLLTQLRQICCHPALFADNYTGGSGKLDMAVETVQMAIESGHRVLLFSQFTSMLSLIRAELDRLGVKYLYLDGATPSKTRMDMASSFNRGENDLFLISLKAGGTGLNLTGADVVMHFDPWWNPAVMDQASDRAHRIGQKRPVQVFRFVARDTIEEKIIELHDRKRSLADNVLTQGEQFISSMSEDEVRRLFEDR